MQKQTHKLAIKTVNLLDDIGIGLHRAGYHNYARALHELMAKWEKRIRLDPPDDPCPSVKSVVKKSLEKKS